MTDKPRTAMEYGSHHVDLVRRTCLTLATRLGDLLDEMVIVGGLVPSLLIDHEALPIGANSHVGTMDLDVGLALALLEQERYHQFSDRLRAAGFSPDHTLDGRLTRQRWRGSGPGSVTVDFLIPPSREFDQAGRLRDLELTSPPSSHRVSGWRFSTSGEFESTERPSWKRTPLGKFASAVLERS